MSRLVGPQGEWWPDCFPCPNCRQLSSVENAIGTDALAVLDLYDLTPEEAYKAFNGLGLPQEQECGPLAVRLAFQQPIKTIRARLVRGTNRSVIDSIEFEDGSSMYFGASPFGAIVYRISEAKRAV